MTSYVLAAWMTTLAAPGLAIEPTGDAPVAAERHEIWRLDTGG